MLNSPYAEYLTTLRRVPDDIILDMATREFIMGDYSTCVCGWALRGALSYLNGATPDAVPSLEVTGSVSKLAKRFGGTEQEWYAIYNEVCYAEQLPDIELAFVERVLEAVQQDAG